MTLKSEPAARLAEMFYEGILAETGWNEALRCVATAMDSVQALIIVRDTDTSRVRIAEHYNVPEAVHGQYNAHYGQYDPALEIIDQLPVGTWYHDRRHVGSAAMSHSAFYQDFMRPHGYASVIANPVLREGTVESLLSLQRMIGQPDYTPQELARVLPLVPHLQRAIRIRGYLQSAADRAGVAERALDQLRIPLMVADETGRVLLANSEAGALMRRRNDVSVRFGRLHLRDAPGRLEPLLKGACGQGRSAAAGGLRLGSAEAGLLQIVATPMPAHIGNPNSWSRPLALLLLQDAAQPQGSAQALLQKLYQLTAAEARVAIAIVGGAVPAAVAAEIGSSLPTVRAQLKAVFAKTGVARQADLVRQLSAVVAVGGGP